MDVHHPDILEFIDCKAQEGEIHNFNISVGASHEFMEAVKAGNPPTLSGSMRTRRIPLRPSSRVGRLDAREVFEKIVYGAWRNGRAGNDLPRLGQPPEPYTSYRTHDRRTNPCGEQPLLPYESCNLGAISLQRFIVEVDGHPTVDYDKLREVVHVATRFLDNVIDANAYSVDKIETMTKATRKIGLGVMGFADMLVEMGIPYDSEEGLELGRKIMRFIKDESDRMSVMLAEERGNFPAYEGSRFDTPDGTPMRNACRLTVAPTGTTSMIAGMLQRNRAPVRTVLPQAQHPGRREPPVRGRELREGGQRTAASTTKT